MWLTTGNAVMIVREILYVCISEFKNVTILNSIGPKQLIYNVTLLVTAHKITLAAIVLYYVCTYSM